MLDINIRLSSYENVLLLIHLPSLAGRGLAFIKKLIEGKIVSPFLPNKVDFNISIRTSRHYEPIRLPQYRTNVELRAPLQMIIKNLN